MKIMFVFDKYDYDMSYHQLMRYLSKAIEELPNNTSVGVKTVNENTNITLFKKSADDKSWKKEVGIFSSSRGVINDTTINNAVSAFFINEPKPDIAEYIYFLVNEKTIIKKKKEVKEALQGKEVHVVIFDFHNKEDVWSTLATDEEYIQVLGDQEQDISIAIQKFKKYTCSGKLPSFVIFLSLLSAAHDELF